MLLFVALVGAVAATSSTAAGRFKGNYSPPSSATQQLNNGIVISRNSEATTPAIAIIRSNNDHNGDGTYRFEFETENRIAHQESGLLKNAGTDLESNVIEGSYSYTGPDGVVYTVIYRADENGFQATGDHIPTAAPIPDDIQQAIEQNAADEAAGIIDDGQYRPEYHQGANTKRPYNAKSNYNQQAAYKY